MLALDVQAVRGCLDMSGSASQGSENGHAAPLVRREDFDYHSRTSGRDLSAAQEDPRAARTATPLIGWRNLVYWSQGVPQPLGGGGDGQRRPKTKTNCSRPPRMSTRAPCASHSTAHYRGSCRGPFCWTTRSRILDAQASRAYLLRGYQQVRFFRERPVAAWQDPGNPFP
ncbi:hypothetical protein PsYK624_150160 [Phanerochaete sordida]|uniref:Uncharacterized protein n=1 Tax=Phanerochaete sordida TaxID=48140 RepID=A0A9P3GNL2_9APHY|nr:hypothetical protein PsYK624_150160 [Phanerochaete sordida]